MKYYGYKFFLSLLRGLVFVKRAVLWIFRHGLPLFKIFGDWYRRVVGFRLFKINFFLSRRLKKYKLPQDSRIVELVFSRFSLQAFFLLIGIVLAIPQSKIYSLDNSTRAGQQILLYSLVGPGYENFESQDVIVNSNSSIPSKNNNESWNDGASSANIVASFDLETPEDEQEIGGVSVGGSAVMKPSILSQNGIVTDSSSNTNSLVTKRDKTTEYKVQSGDVIGSIAGRFGVKVTTILWANGLTSRSYIRPGDTLKIPPSDGLLYTVKKGDTVGKIAKLFGVDQSTVIAFNKMQKDGADIVIGEDLFLPGASMQANTGAGNIAIGNSKITNTLRKIAAPLPSLDVPAGGGYIWPTGAKRVTQYFGWRHTGIDIAGPIGTPNYAAKGGKVIKSQCGWNGGYGCYVILDHGGSVTSLYGHNSKLLVSVGDTVKQGDAVGLLGSTGRSTGPHIHFEVRVGGKRVNPLQYIR